MKIIISGRAAAFDNRTQKKITRPALLKKLHGVTYDKSSCCGAFGRDLDEIGLIGGHLRLVYRTEGNQLRIVTEYHAPRALTPDELSALLRETTAQWSDGIGESYFWQDVGPGFKVDLAPLFEDHDLRTEQLDDGVAVPVPVPRLTPLMKAAEAGDLDRIRQLLAQGEDVNARGRNGDTALERAIVMGHVDAALLLIQQGAQVEADSLHYACMTRQSTPELLQALVGASADVNARDSRGATPLMWAANRERLDLARWLLEHGADPNVRDTHLHNEGQTALMYTHHLDIIELLLEHGADPNVREDRGLAAYEMACSHADFWIRTGVGNPEKHASWTAAAEALLAVLHERAAAGDAASLYTLADYHDRGLGVAEDLGEAFRAYERSAGNGYRLALVRLGLCYRDAAGTEADPARALDLFHRAAEAGVPLALGVLGECHAEGLGVPLDEAEAARWYRRGAEIDPSAGAEPNEVCEFRRGVAACRGELGACYEAGKGVPKDLREALKWYQAALELGFHAAGRAAQRVQKALFRRIRK
jgi:hypothetical protein